MQIDWISAMASSVISPGYSSGYSVRIDPDGEVLSERRSPLDVEEPSSSKKFRVWTPDENRLYISGNPIKILQNHNCWGSCDALGLYLEAGLWIRERVGLFPSHDIWKANQFKIDRFNRLDITRSYRFDNSATASAFIRHVAGSSRSRHGAARLYKSETAVFGQGSHRWSFKVYNKGEELLKNKIDDERILDWASGVVRFELTIRTKELEGLNLVEFEGSEVLWKSKLTEIWLKYYSRIDWSGGVMAEKLENNLIENTLPTGVRLALDSWRFGTDLRQKLPRATFYRYRKQILNHLSIDISSPPPKEKINNPEVAPLSLNSPGWDPVPIEDSVSPRAELKEAYDLYKRPGV